MINKLYEKKLINTFSQIKIFSIENKKDVIELSSKFKGRILAAIQKN